jgi:hypothetical protein
MPNISRRDRNHIEISLESEDAAKSYWFDPGMSPIAAVGTTPEKSAAITATIKINRQFADQTRAMSGVKLTEKFGRNDLTALLSGFMQSPIPVYTTDRSGDANIPDLTDEESSVIPTLVSSVPVSMEVDFQATVSLNVPYVIIGLPDAFGIDFYLCDMSVDIPMNYGHAGIMTQPFFFPDTYNDEYDEIVTSDGPGTNPPVVSLNDAKVAIIEKEEEGAFLPTLDADLIHVGETLRVHSVELYCAVFEEMGWREGRVSKASIDPEGKPSFYAGINMLGNAVQMIEVNDTLIENFKLLMYSGSMTSKYIVGDIRYPFQPNMTTGNIRFDIVTDSDKWTDAGPTVSAYEGGDAADDGVEFIFSWEGRTNTHAKKISRIAAGLPDIGD